MAACDPLTFHDISQAKWDCLKLKISERGYGIDGDSGALTDRGFTVEWQYDAGGQILTVRCTAKPTLVPCALVNSRIRDAFERSGC